MLRVLVAFIVAVVGAALVGSVMQTQFNLAEIINLSVGVDMSTRMDTIIHDILHFGPVFAAILTPTLILSFLVAHLCAKRTPRFERAWFMVGGGLGLALAFTLIDALAPMPTLIAANRTLLGFVLMSSTGAFAGWIFNRLWHPQARELSEELPA